MSNFRLHYRYVYISQLIDLLKSYFYDINSIIFVNISDITPIPYIQISKKQAMIQEDTLNFGDSFRIYIFDSIELCPLPFCGTIMIHKFTDKIFVKKYTLSCFLFRSIIRFNKNKFIKIISNRCENDIYI